MLECPTNRSTVNGGSHANLQGRNQYPDSAIVAAGCSRALRRRGRRESPIDQWQDFGAGRRRSGARAAGRHCECHLAESSGHPHHHDVRQRRLHLHGASGRGLYDLVRAQRIPAATADGHPRTDTNAAARCHHGSRGTHRDGVRRRTHGRRADADGAGRHELQAGSRRYAANEPGHQFVPAAGSRRAPDRSKGRVLDFWFGIVRKPVFGQRRDGQREHPWPGE